MFRFRFLLQLAHVPCGMFRLRICKVGTGFSLARQDHSLGVLSDFSIVPRFCWRDIFLMVSD